MDRLEALLQELRDARFHCRRMVGVYRTYRGARWSCVCRAEGRAPWVWAARIDAIGHVLDAHVAELRDSA